MLKWDLKGLLASTSCVRYTDINQYILELFLIRNRITFQGTPNTANNSSVRQLLLVFFVMKMVNVIVNAKTIRKFLYSSRPREQFLMELFISLTGNFSYVFKLIKTRYILPVYNCCSYCEFCKFYKVLFSERKYKYKTFCNTDFCLPTFVFVLIL